MVFNGVGDFAGVLATFLRQPAPSRCPPTISAGNGRQRKGTGMPTKTAARWGSCSWPGWPRRRWPHWRRAIAQKEPGTMGESERPTVLRRLQGVNFIGNCRFSHRGAGRPDRLLRARRRVPRPQLRRQPDDERVLDHRLAARRLDDVPAPGETAAYWMPTLYVDGSPTRRRCDDLLPAEDAAERSRLLRAASR